MPRNLVICCDGTGNEIGRKMTNVLKLYRVAQKRDNQRVYYNPGVGTIGQQNPFTRIRQNIRKIAGLAFGLGLDDDVLGAYRFLCTHWQEGDKVYLFGFSRGAYTVRALAAFIHVIGLLRPDQLNLAGYAWTAFKRAASDTGSRDRAEGSEGELIGEGLKGAWHFGRVVRGEPIRIHFLDVWDTVASVIVPRLEQLSFNLETLPFTQRNPAVRTFRQASAIDERRRMFRLLRWHENQLFREQPFVSGSEIAQDAKEVWFAGVHSDVGGGYIEENSGLSKYPLAWMLDEAAKAGLKVDKPMLRHLVYGEPHSRSRHRYAPPDFEAKLHRSLSVGWSPLEIVPKLRKYCEWKSRPSLLGLYVPLAEPRPIPDHALVHQSALSRREAGIGYSPINWPSEPTIVAMSKPPQRRRRSTVFDDDGVSQADRPENRR